MRINRIAASLFSLGMVASPFAFATNGMNLEGYGPVAEAMGGASMAYDNGTAAVMNNPATLGLMKEDVHFDAALGVLAPSIKAKMPGASADSSATAFYMPAVGYARKSGQWVYGAAVFSQGGMGTEYDSNSFMAAGTGEKVRSEVGVGRFIVPLVYKPNDQVTVGGSLDFVWAGMDLKMALSGAQFGDMVAGLGGTQTYGAVSGSMADTLVGAFTVPQAACGGVPCLSTMNWARVDFSNSSAFTGQAKGNGSAFKLGGTYKVNEQLTLGATFHSKTSLGDLTTTGASMAMNVTGPATMGTPTTITVNGSVAVKNFQWPQTFAFGAAYQANDQLLLVADFKRIGWKDVMKNFSMTFTANSAQDDPSATAFGLGGQVVNMSLNQNWDDQNVIQLGGAYKSSDALTLRAGLNMANNPVPDKYMHPLFPAIAKNHLTLGAGYAISSNSKVDFSYVYVPTVTATNGSGISVDFAGYSAQLLYAYMY
ncbi:MAG: outer membrane protein transport protein [Nitrosomonadales bacterium]|nr:outer membrane protein transport protein [Nitrosomonadales bacterium]